MSKELADRFDRDLSASEETADRARRARKEGAALDIDWETAFEVYDAQANQDPKKFIRFPEAVLEFEPPSMILSDDDEVVSGDEPHESAASQ